MRMRMTKKRRKAFFAFIQNGQFLNLLSLSSTRMSQNKSLQQFLDNHKADGLWTHTSLKGGKYFIPDEHKDQFYDLYVEEIINQEKQYLTEKSSDIGPLRVDFDFIYGTDVTRHLHTRDQVTMFCEAYMKEIVSLVYQENEKGADIFTYKKRNPFTGTFYNKGIKDLERSKLMCELDMNIYNQYKRYCDYVENLEIKDDTPVSNLDFKFLSNYFEKKINRIKDFDL